MSIDLPRPRRGPFNGERSDRPQARPLPGGEGGLSSPQHAHFPSLAFGCLLLACWLLQPSGAHAGRVQTLDGRAYDGDVHLTNNAVVVSATNGALNTVPLGQLLLATFEPGVSTPALANGSGIGLLGHYFSTSNAQGNEFVRLDDTIDFDWNTKGPTPELPREQFSVLWSGELEAPASGLFNLSLNVRGAARLYFTNRLLVQSAANPGVQAGTIGATVPLEAGRRYPLRVFYANGRGPGQVQLLWRGPNVPRSVIPRRALHPEDLNSVESAPGTGLLGTYYPNSEFGGSPLARIDPTINFDWSSRDPAPGIARTNFSVRWLGQIRADFTEEYTFYSLTDERARVWIDNRLVLDPPDQGWLAESKGSIPLVAGESYELRMETRSTIGGAVARLFWSSASVAKTNPPSTHLVPWHQAAQLSLGPDSGGKTGPGVLLRDGSFLSGSVQQATQTSLRLSNPLTPQPLTTVQIARIVCQPLSPALAKRMTPGRSGLLLAKGDFVDGEFRSLEQDRVNISSVLFGQRSYDVKTDVLVVALHEVGDPGGGFEIRLRDQSVLRPARIDVEPDALRFTDPALGPVRIAVAEIQEVRRRGGTAESSGR